jgi:hypothetical protein
MRFELVTGRDGLPKRLTHTRSARIEHYLQESTKDFPFSIEGGKVKSMASVNEPTPEEIKAAMVEELNHLSDEARFEPHYDIDDVIEETETWFTELDSLDELAGTSKQ